MMRTGHDSEYRVPGVQLTIPVDGEDDGPGHPVRSWFEAGFPALGGALGTAVLTRAEHELHRANRTPGAVTADLVVRERPLGLPDLDVPYSAQSWQRFLDALHPVPGLAALDIQTNDDRGRPNWPSMQVCCSSPGVGDQWRLLTLDCSDPALADTDAGQQALRVFLRSMAETTNPSYGEISFWSGLPRTALETGLALLPRDIVPVSRQQARGYAWVTILADEIGQRLGGLDGLRGSGAFAEVARLAAGGFWLQATPQWQEFGPAQARRVFDVLAPVLPPGRPRHPVGPNVLVPEDPRDRDARRRD